MAAQLGSEIEAHLVQTRRFSVLDRTTLGASLAELALVGSDLTGPAEKAKLKRIKGADYILLTTVRRTDRAARYSQATRLDASVTAMGMSSPEQKVLLLAYILRSTRGWLVE